MADVQGVKCGTQPAQTLATFEETRGEYLFGGISCVGSFWKCGRCPVRFDLQKSESNGGLKIGAVVGYVLLAHNRRISTVCV